MEKTCGKLKTIGIKLYEELHCQGTHCQYFEVKKWLVHKAEKKKKKNLTIISKPHAHPDIMKETPAKFQDRYKTVKGVALTRHLR